MAVKNPYEILNVSESASDEEVKRAYREMVKKYHPDRYTDNPLKELADEKLREVNAAYDQILNSRKNGSSQSYNYENRNANTNGNQYEYRRNVYNRGYDSSANELCKVCQCLICSDCCCECLGGDLIGCC
jgi:molecular chaperone DnaJ